MMKEECRSCLEEMPGNKPVAAAAAGWTWMEPMGS